MTSNLKRYFKNTTGYSNIRFILEMTAICYVGKILGVLLITAIALVFIFLGSDDFIEFMDKEFIKEDTSGSFDIYALLVAPWFETVIGQVIPISLVSLMTKNLYFKLLLSASFFAILHVNPASVISAFAVGLILAWSFVVKSKQSKLQGLIVTSGIHFSHNLLAFLIQNNFYLR